MSGQITEGDLFAGGERAAAYRAFVQDARAAGFVDLVENTPEPISTLTPREVDARYGLPAPLVDLQSLPTIQGERACTATPAAFLVDRYDDDGVERSKDVINREIAAAKRICGACIALDSCRVYAEAAQAALPPRSRVTRDSHVVIMAGVAYAR